MEGRRRAGRRTDRGAGRRERATRLRVAGLRAAASIAPADLLLVETDAPFLTPMPHRGRPNAPYLIPLTMRTLAQVRGEALDQLCADVAANWHRAFGVAQTPVADAG